MKQLVLKQFQSSEIVFSEDGWINATETAKNFGKQAYEYLRAKSTQDYMKALANKLNSDTENLRITRKGNTDKFEQGTFLHPKLAIDFARWISPEFAIWCDDVISELLNKNQKPLTPAQMILQQAQQLVEHEEELRAIQESRAEATKYLEQVAKEPVQALQVSTRKAFDALVKAYAEKTGADVPLIFNVVYKEFSLRYRKDVFTLAKKTKQSVISYIESAGYITELYQVAKEVLK